MVSRNRSKLGLGTAINTSEYRVVTHFILAVERATKDPVRCVGSDLHSVLLLNEQVGLDARRQSNAVGSKNAIHHKMIGRWQ